MDAMGDVVIDVFVVDDVVEGNHFAVQLHPSAPIYFASRVAHLVQLQLHILR